MNTVLSGFSWRRRASHQRCTDDTQASRSRQHTPSDWRVALASIRLRVVNIQMVGHCDNVLDVFGARCELRRSDDGTLRHAAHQPDGWQRPNAIDLSPVSHIGTEPTVYCVKKLCKYSGWKWVVGHPQFSSVDMNISLASFVKMHGIKPWFYCNWFE